MPFSGLSLPTKIHETISRGADARVEVVGQEVVVEHESILEDAGPHQHHFAHRTGPAPGRRHAEPDRGLLPDIEPSARGTEATREPR